MKKILLSLITLSLFSFASAQEIQFIGQDEITYGDPSSTDVASYITVKNNSDIERDIKVRRNPIDMPEGTSHWFCWVLCWQDDVDTSNFHLRLDPGEETQEFSAHFNPDGEVYDGWSVEYCFYDVNDTDFEFCTTVNWSTADPLSTNDLVNLEISHPQPNPCTDQVRFNILNEIVPEDASLSLFSVVGKQVKQQRIPVGTDQVVLDVNDLAPGVYIYSLMSGANKINSGRLVVK